MSKSENLTEDHVSSVETGKIEFSSGNTTTKPALTMKKSVSNLKSNDSQNSLPEKFALICLSHLRWNFVYQRPQHLLSRCAKERTVFFIEEPIFSADTSPCLDVSIHESGVSVVVPHLKEGMTEEEVTATLKRMLDDLLAQKQIKDYILWYYTPMALSFTRHLNPLLVVYDCMDELSAFKGASPALKTLEIELFSLGDLVFTGGQSLYEAKRDRHPHVYAFPSSIDKVHFGKARNLTEEPADQINIPHPRLGFFGVIDERMDIDLLSEIAQARPDWHLVMIGPVVKIDPATLPRHTNIHYLGGKSYQELPAYIAGWDIAMLPFALNESTRFISPTKTPEYLAAGKPVISTSIRDVVRPYGENGLVKIADNVTDFIAAAEELMSQDFYSSGWLERVDTFLAENSWDSTWRRMMQLIESAMSDRLSAKTANS
ncbi:glycosyltransferase family 1 protein [Phormidium sp. LEGE 05292]|uniref:glycosyltransferase family 1 protein n=1 Tax=[Phormidium] sp. LEGE 05292 TaxID=767427 RepID=UPI00187DF0F9|nr:glycosyltransferase family 1 protein [Phormidium sp. LEGE 05292]MBE9227274.1 glycosyltransferase family 1 protein [Phormidium sp. LEGE 05292]